MFKCLLGEVSSVRSENIHGIALLTISVAITVVLLLPVYHRRSVIGDGGG